MHLRIKHQVPRQDRYVGTRATVQRVVWSGLVWLTPVHIQTRSQRDNGQAGDRSSIHPDRTGEASPAVVLRGLASGTRYPLTAVARGVGRPSTFPTVRHIVMPNLGDRRVDLVSWNPYATTRMQRLPRVVSSLPPDPLPGAAALVIPNYQLLRLLEGFVVWRYENGLVLEASASLAARSKYGSVADEVRTRN